MYVIRTFRTCYSIGPVHGMRISYFIPSLYVIRMYVITSFDCIEQNFEDENSHRPKRVHSVEHWWEVTEPTQCYKNSKNVQNCYENH